MRSIREQYDDRIPAGELCAGDELHLTFMGGDDYVDVDDVTRMGDQVKWWGQTYGGQIVGTIPASEKVWIRKRVGE